MKVNGKIACSMIAFLVLLCGLSVYGCGKKQQSAPAVKEPEKVPVRTQKVALKDMQEVFEYVANIKAFEEAAVYPKVPGTIIEKVKADGDIVAKGDPIVMIDRDEVGLSFEKAPVDSPMNGVVGKVMVDIGTRVTAQTPVALIVDMDRIRVYLDVPEKYLPRITSGMRADITVEAYPEESFAGDIIRVSPIVDVDTRTGRVEIHVDNSGHKLYSGMYAKVKVVTKEHKKAAAVLKEAVLGKDPDFYVYIIKDGKAAMRDVKLGVRQGPYFQVTEGLSPGDSVVVMGQQRLNEGAPVLMEE